MPKTGFVYIMSNKNRTTFYIGITNNLERRVAEHRLGEGSTFTSKYKLFDLVFFEMIPNIQQAIAREKQLKRWHREWKINLIREENPEMKDLAADW
jgi:putative endonuclease